MPIHVLPKRTGCTETLEIKLPKKVADAFREYADDSGEPIERWLLEALTDYAEAIIPARMGEDIEPLYCGPLVEAHVS